MTGLHVTFQLLKAATVGTAAYVQPAIPSCAVFFHTSKCSVCSGGVPGVPSSDVYRARRSSWDTQCAISE
eukprot:3872303-Pleurochrysis_carterae.AAC.1